MCCSEALVRKVVEYFHREGERRGNEDIWPTLKEVASAINEDIKNVEVCLELLEKWGHAHTKSMGGPEGRWSVDPELIAKLFPDDWQANLLATPAPRQNIINATNISGSNLVAGDGTAVAINGKDVLEAMMEGIDEIPEGDGENKKTLRQRIETLARHPLAPSLMESVFRKVFPGG